MTIQKDGDFCKVVFINEERFDPVDSITGTIRLEARGSIVASRCISITNLGWHISHVEEIYPLGGRAISQKMAYLHQM